MRTYKLRSVEFYKDWLRAVLIRENISHDIFTEEGILKIAANISGHQFHKCVLRAQCEKEESENNLDSNVISMEEYECYERGQRLIGDDVSPYFAVFCRCDERKRFKY